MYSLILATILSTMPPPAWLEADPMPPPAWLEADPMPPPAVTAAGGIIDTIRQAKALIGKGNVLADRGKAILDAAQRDGKITVDICLPVAEAATVEVDEPLVEVEQIHTARPTVKPMVLTHSYRGWPGCSCPMCQGQHLRNAHGKTTATLDKIGYRGWPAYHSKLHAEGVAPKAVQSGCENGQCRTPTRRIRFPNLGARWRR